MDAFVIKATAFSAALLAALASAATAQTAYETGGVQLSFGLGLRLEAQDNRSLDVNNARSSFETAANLSLGLLSETQTQRFSFDLGGRLRAIDAPDTNLDNGFVEPFGALRYDRSNASAHLALSATLRETDLSDNDILDDDGLEVIQSDGGTRRRSIVEARLDWRQDTPLGFGVFARREDNSYHGGTATGLDGQRLRDNHRNTAGVSTRMDLTPATALNMALSYSDYEESGTPGSRETISLYNSLTFERPRGPVSISLDATDTEEGERIAAALGRTLELQSGVLTAQIGATHAASGEDYLTGNLGYNHLLPNGALDISLARAVTSSNEEDSEQLNTRLNLGYSMDLSPLSGLRLHATWSETEETSGSGSSSTNTLLGAVYSREMTPEWNLDAGYRYRIRDNESRGRADSNTVFLELRRNFITRF